MNVFVTLFTATESVVRILYEVLRGVVFIKDGLVRLHMELLQFFLAPSWRFSKHCHGRFLILRNLPDESLLLLRSLGRLIVLRFNAVSIFVPARTQDDAQAQHGELVVLHLLLLRGVHCTIFVG